MAKIFSVSITGKDKHLKLLKNINYPVFRGCYLSTPVPYAELKHIVQESKYAQASLWSVWLYRRKPRFYRHHMVSMDKESLCLDRVLHSPDIKMNQTVKSAFYSHKRFFYTRGMGGQRKSPPHPTGNRMRRALFSAPCGARTHDLRIKSP